jgi:hypothetical protein
MRPHPSSILLSIAILVLALVASGCAPRGENTWKPGTPAKANAIVIAPVAAPALVGIYRTASTDFAYDIANRIDFLGRDADGLAAPDLPRADDAVWAGPVPAASGAPLVLLVRVTSIAPINNAGRPMIEGTCELRVVDATGTELFAKTAHGRADVTTSPKMMADSAKPESQAAWAACANATGALLDWLRARPDRVLVAPKPAPAPVEPVPVPAVLVAITVASQPDHADVLVDGQLRGTTPMVLSLPQREIRLRLERQGHVPWERVFTPEADMQLSPALDEVIPAVKK